jgi:serine/threonine-protein kinase
MPPPTTVPDLLDRVRRSGIIPGDRLEGFLVGLQASGRAPATPADVLDRLVDAGMITRFHADRLAAGKYKGFQLGSYLILDQLGVGGMGQVYLAEHVNMRRLAALKVLPPLSFDDPVARERFFREARAAGTLDHPNIVRVFDLCQEGKILYLVMEYVEGVSLQEVVGRHGPLDVGAACHYARQVAFGLQHAHELGFVHRDVKPANLLVDRVGVVKILDFGLVRSETESGAGLTRRLDNKLVLGTADYVAPEQAMDSSSVDIRADVYSLGATLYFALTGRPLFPGGRVAQKLVWQQVKDPVPVDGLRPEVPAELAAVVHRMLAKKPADRFQSPAEVFDALAPFIPDEVPVPEPAWLPEPPGRVALSRHAPPNPGTLRVSGSTSQILAAAMRGGSGVGSASAIRRKAPAPDDTATDSARVTTTPPPRRNDSETPTADAKALDTQRTVSTLAKAPAVPATPPTRRGTTAVIVALTVALVLAVLGIIVLLLRD